MPPAIITGYDSTAQLAEIIPHLDITKLFLIISGTLAEEDYIPKLLRDGNIPYFIFSPPKGEPTFESVRLAQEKLTVSGCDGIAAIGGGSIIDLAKAVSVFAIHREDTLETIQSRTAIKRLPFIAVPTTAGSGSEATKVMVITEKGIKRNPAHRTFLPDAAVLDPRWLTRLPPDIAAFTGLDALTHAIEAYVSTKANEMTDFYALQAIKLIGHSLPLVYDKTADEITYSGLLLGSTFAGIAFSNSSTNLAHAAGRSLGAKFHLPHGLSVALLHPLVIKFGLEACQDRYADIAIALGFQEERDKNVLAEHTLRFVEGLNDRFGIYRHGSKYISHPEQFASSIPELAGNALGGNGISTNHRLPGKEDVEHIFHELNNRVSNQLREEYI